jgi:hypothetical protein
MTESPLREISHPNTQTHTTHALKRWLFIPFIEIKGLFIDRVRQRSDATDIFEVFPAQIVASCGDKGSSLLTIPIYNRNGTRRALSKRLCLQKLQILALNWISAI